MAHTRMFDPDDPVLAVVRRLALDLPDAAEKVSHGRPAFYTTKVFCYYGGSVRRGKGDWVQHPQSIMVLPDERERPALEADPRVFVPAYLGGAGWLGVDLTPETDHDEIGELLQDSYRRTAGVRRVARLDARG